MPPPVKEPITFLGWIEDLFKSTVNLPKKSIEVYRDNYTGALSIVVKSSSAKVSDNAALISAFVESPEAFKDISGVNTKVSIEDFIRQPLKTLDSIGRKTLNDIARIDDVSSQIRSETIEALTRGKTTLNGRNLRNPQNRVVKAAVNLGIPFTDISGLIDPLTGSKISLLVNSNVANPDQFDDRKTVEENEKNDSQYKTYTVLSGALTGMAADYENPSNVLTYRDQALRAYNQTVMREMGIDLDSVFSTTTAKKTQFETLHKHKIFLPGSNKGSFDTVLAGAPGANPLLKLNAVTSNDALLASALGKTPAEVAASPELREIYQLFLESEFRNFDMDKMKDKTDPLDKRKISAIGETGTQADQEKTRIAMELQLKIEAYRTQINATVEANILAKKSGMITTEVANRNAAMAAGTGHGPMRLVGGMLIPMPIPWTPAELTLDGTELTIDTQLRAQAARARERLMAATKTMDMAHNLYFASTTKNLLEAIEKGSFLNTFFISSRFAGSLPFISNTIWDGKNNPLIGFIDDKATWFDDRGLSPGKVAEAAGLYTGLAFEIEEDSKLKGLSKLTKLESEINIEWKTPVAGPIGSHVWHQRTVKAGEGAGIFGDWGIYDTVNRASLSNGKMLRDNMVPVADFLNPEDLLGDRAKIRTFFDNLISESEALKLNSGVPDPASPYQNFAKEFGVVTTNTVTDPITGVVTTVVDDASLAKLKTQYTAYTSGTGGENLLFTTLNQPNGVPATGRWEFLKLIDKQGKTAQFTKKYMGYLNWYNRKANGIQSFAYKQILFGKYGGSNGLVKGLIKISTPIRNILQTFGIGDEIILSEAIAKWGFVQKATQLGKYLQTPNAASIAALQAMGGRIGTVLASSVASLARSVAGKALLQSVGYLLSGLGGALTGGIGWVVAAFGDVMWKFGKNALKLNFKRAWAEAKEAMQAKWEVVKKVIIYPLACACGCIIAPIGLIIIVIASQLANLNPFGGGTQADIQSKLISVAKTAQVVGNAINYTITITNISGEDAIDIEPITDTLNFTYPCGVESGTTVTYPNNSNGYNWNVVNFPSGQTGTINKTAPLVLSYTVNNIINGTYFNFIEVKAVGEIGRSATSSVSNDIGGGGCVTCPAGWPLSTAGTNEHVVTQGRYTNSTHSATEAVDIAPSNYIYDVSSGQQILSTHRGTVWFSVSSEGYGNLAVVRSPQNFSTYYAHLDRFNDAISSGDQVDAGTFLGIMGTTGNSTGPHLHYEFRLPENNPNYACLSGHKLELVNIQSTQSYVPKNIPKGCVGSVSCENITIP